MFTKNFYIASSGYDFRNASCSPSAGGLSMFDSSKDTSANYAKSRLTAIPTILETVLTKSRSDILNNTYIQSRMYGVIFANGTTEPTLTDRATAGEHLTTLTESHSVNTSYNDTGTTVTATYTITNTGASDFTISEVAVCDDIYYPNSGGYTRYLPLLIARELLDEPVTIPAGGIGQVTITLTMNYPTE